MNIAYKYLVADNGVMLVFPVINERLGSKNMPFDHVVINDQQYLRIGESLYVPLDDELLEVMEKVDSIMLGESGPYDFKVRFVGSVRLEPVFVGKLLAYYEMVKDKFLREKENPDRAA